MQLRPKVANFDLSVENTRGIKYNLDVSLFERLCFSGVPSTSAETFKFPLAQLTIQRRMRPGIADLVRIPLYHELKDHQDVQEYPSVAGMYQPLYWLDHQHREDGEGPMDMKETSHSNDFEVEMVTQLVSHLSKQDGYQDGDIAVLTPYVGQLRKLRDSLGSAFLVQLSEQDEEDVAALEEFEMTSAVASGVVTKRQTLEQSVRIATVCSPQVAC